MAASATVPSVPLGEYLGSVYRPDVDYVDGEIEERNVGELDHATLQKVLLLILAAQERTGGYVIWPELRVRVSPTRFRVPDLCLMRADWKKTPVVEEAPLLPIEILSPRDNVAGMRARCEDYLRMGSAEVWIFDPATRTAYVLRGGELFEQRGGTLRVPQTSVAINLEGIFATLDA